MFRAPVQAKMHWRFNNLWITREHETCYLLSSTNRCSKTRGCPVQASSLSGPSFPSLSFRKSLGYLECRRGIGPAFHSSGVSHRVAVEACAPGYNLAGSESMLSPGLPRAENSFYDLVRSLDARGTRDADEAPGGAGVCTVRFVDAEMNWHFTLRQGLS